MVQKKRRVVRRKSRSSAPHRSSRRLKYSGRKPSKKNKNSKVRKLIRLAKLKKR
ncbi:hypothetical protein HY483_02135 [Candidatus Woesearchaeota archaeon]|nr:hypothetical protein [Candidatus Woesearchaeota archaeon]